MKCTEDATVIIAWNRPMSHPCPGYTLWRKEKYVKEKAEGSIRHRKKLKEAELAANAITGTTSRNQGMIVKQKMDDKIEHRRRSEGIEKEIDEFVASLHHKWRKDAKSKMAIIYLLLLVLISVLVFLFLKLMGYH